MREFLERRVHADGQAVCDLGPEPAVGAGGGGADGGRRGGDGGAAAGRGRAGAAWSRGARAGSVFGDRSGPADSCRTGRGGVPAGALGR